MPLFDTVNSNALRSAYQPSGKAGLAQRPNTGPFYDAAGAYSAGIPTQAQNYDEIMQGYRGILGGGNYGGLDSLIAQYQKGIEGLGQPTDVDYEEAPEWREAYNRLNELSQTGGLSNQEQQSLRARSISPIRAVYANAQRNLDRQRALSGGGGANYNASAAKMAREMSEQVAQGTTNANAAIAEMVQKGKLAMSPELAKLAAGKNELMNKVNLSNQENRGQWAGNLSQLLSGLSRVQSERSTMPLQALQGMTSLYAANPGWSETFGNQMNQQRQTSNQHTQAMGNLKTNRLRSALGA